MAVRDHNALGTNEKTGPEAGRRAALIQCYDLHHSWLGRLTIESPPTLALSLEAGMR